MTVTEPRLRASYERAMRVLDSLEATQPMPIRRRLATGSQHPRFETCTIGPEEKTLVDVPVPGRSRTRRRKLPLPPPIPKVGLRRRARTDVPPIASEIDSVDAPTARVDLRMKSEPAMAVAARHRSSKILRFVIAERLLHWALAIPFLICLLTAAALLFYFNPDPTRPYRDVVSWVHKVSGICFIGFPIGVLLASPRYFGVFWENIKEGWIWTKRDIKWIMLKPLSVLSSRIALPEEGKFNAGEKLNFMWTMASWPMYAATGLVIWLAGAFGAFGVYPWLAHLALAAISVPLLAGHIFMAVVNPSTRKGLSGMTSGLVDRGWAKHHYRRWYKEKFGRAGTSTSTAIRLHGRARTASVMIDIGRAVSPATIALLLLLGGGGVAAGVYYAGTGAGIAPVETNARYMGSDASLLSAADESAEPVAGGPIVRGAEVEKLRDEHDFAFVRDGRGRTGFVFADDLFRERPRFDSSAFAADACVRAPGESEAGGCRLRADERRILCELDCAAGDGDCRGRCEAGQQSCVAACDAGEDEAKDER